MYSVLGPLVILLAIVVFAPLAVIAFMAVAQLICLEPVRRRLAKFVTGRDS